MPSPGFAGLILDAYKFQSRRGYGMSTCYGMQDCGVRPILMACESVVLHKFGGWVSRASGGG